MRIENHKWQLALLSCVIAFVLSGCWDAKDVDNRLLVGAIGLEKSTGASLRVWFRFPLPKATQELKQDFFTLSENDFTVPGAMNKVKYKLPKALDASSTRALLLGESLARSGLSPYLEFAIRERSIPLDAVVAIVRGNMEHIFKRQNPTGELSGIYTKLFFEKYAGGIPRKNVTRLWEVYSKIFNPLHANLIPLLTEGAQNSFEFIGNAIFFNGKMVGELSRDESLIYQMFTHRLHDAEVELLNRSDVRITHKYTHVISELVDGKPVIQFECWLVTTLTDSARLQKLTKKEIITDLDSKFLEDAKSMFIKTQRAGADIFGLGNRFRSRLQPSQYNDWSEMFKNASISYKFHIDMRNTGLEFLQ